MSEAWNEWPLSLDWEDAGKSIEAVLEDGSTVAGVLYCEDVMADDDGEEWPFWAIEIEGRGKVTWADKWRFSQTPRPA